MQEPVSSFDRLDGPGLVAVLDRLPELVSFWDRDHRCVFANAAAAAAFGRPAEALRNVPLVDVLGTHAAKLMHSRFLNALEGEGSEQERALFDGDGELRHYRGTYTPVYIGEVVIGVAVVRVDITEELNTQAEIFRNSLQVAQLTERQRLMTAAGTEVLARLRRTLDQLQPPNLGDDPEARLQRLAEELRSCTRRLREGAQTWPAATADSAGAPPAPRTVSTSPLSAHQQDLGGLLSASSSPARHHPSVVPPTAGLEAKIFALLDQLPVAVSVWDRTRTLRYANRAEEELLARWGHTSATGRRLEQIVTDDFLRTHQLYAEDVLRGRTQSFHRRQVSPDGQEHHFHVRYVPRIADGEVVGAFAYASNITDVIKAGEELIQARSACAALQEHQAIEDRLHDSILQELFAAALLLDAAARAEGDTLALLEEPRTYVQMAMDGLAQLS